MVNTLQNPIYNPQIYDFYWEIKKISKKIKKILLFV